MQTEDCQFNYALFKDEDLLGRSERSERVARDLCQFCEIDFNEGMLSPKNRMGYNPNALKIFKNPRFKRATVIGESLLKHQGMGQ